MLNNVMPQRGVFFNLLTLHTERMVGAANATLRLITGLGNPHAESAQLIDEVNTNETSADGIKAELVHLLYASFTTPINRDQIHTLTLDLDRVVDALQSVANSISTHHISNSTAPARELASLGADACIRLNRAVAALAGHERVREILQQCEEVDAIEARAAHAMRQAITQLFAYEGDEAAAWHAMKMHGFYALQAQVLNSCKRAAKTLEEILLENA